MHVALPRDRAVSVPDVLILEGEVRLTADLVRRQVDRSSLRQNAGMLGLCLSEMKRILREVYPEQTERDSSARTVRR